MGLDMRMGTWLGCGMWWAFFIIFHCSPFLFCGRMALEGRFPVIIVLFYLCISLAWNGQDLDGNMGLVGMEGHGMSTRLWAHAFVIPLIYTYTSRIGYRRSHY
jgi:hypothetical protein